MTKFLYNDRLLQGGINPLENPQIKEMPLPGVFYIGKIYQYVGETTEAFENGCFYKCIMNEYGKYIWIQILPQSPGQDQPTTLTPFTKLTLTLANTNFNSITWGQNYQAWIDDQKWCYIIAHLTSKSSSGYPVQSAYILELPADWTNNLINENYTSILINGTETYYSLQFAYNYKKLKIVRGSGTYPAVKTIDLQLRFRLQL